MKINCWIDMDTYRVTITYALCVRTFVVSVSTCFNYVVFRSCFDSGDLDSNSDLCHLICSIYQASLYGLGDKGRKETVRLISMFIFFLQAYQLACRCSCAVGTPYQFLFLGRRPKCR